MGMRGIMKRFFTWVHSSDARMVAFWVIICGSIMITLAITMDILNVVDSLTTTQVGGPVARRR